ncbi:putative tRNA nucleotidyltransferase [Cyclospora cayetanensis]|uniref:tRNA nucleotidyltransferase n=1 Tax=Cyclospora cayetanensis TaxID=88456 RepID=A0A1D3D341_9EIME|nr:putative tRNA nucleotidyltransferase [Cyclospora cayetanensis]
MALVFTGNSKTADRRLTLQMLWFAAIASRFGLSSISTINCSVVQARISLRFCRWSTRPATSATSNQAEAKNTNPQGSSTAIESPVIALPEDVSFAIAPFGAAREAETAAILDSVASLTSEGAARAASSGGAKGASAASAEAPPCNRLMRSLSSMPSLSLTLPLYYLCVYSPFGWGGPPVDLQWVPRQSSDTGDCTQTRILDELKKEIKVSRRFVFCFSMKRQALLSLLLLTLERCLGSLASPDPLGAPLSHFTAKHWGHVGYNFSNNTPKHCIRSHPLSTSPELSGSSYCSGTGSISTTSRRCRIDQRMRRGTASSFLSFSFHVANLSWTPRTITTNASSAASRPGVRLQPLPQFFLRFPLKMRHISSVPTSGAAIAAATVVVPKAAVGDSRKESRVAIKASGAAAASGAASNGEETDLLLPSASEVAEAAARAPAAVAAGVTLQLTQEEKELFCTLNKCVVDKELNIELRAAGGWVRDKLLGIPSQDIDIAIDSITGARFATLLNRGVFQVSVIIALVPRCLFAFRWLVSKGKSPHAVGIISKNAAQSKHLETATLTMHPFSLDLVNLRSESYCSNSRIPSTTAIGTPLQDAARRDFCCNALFYNLKTGLVEDWLGRGLDDIRHCILRAASSSPNTTLLEDPLRLLRGVRFAAVLDFRLERTLAAAGADPDIHEALMAKVARERIGVEIKKIFSIAHKKRDSQKQALVAQTATGAAVPNGRGPAEQQQYQLLEGPLNKTLRGVLLMLQLRVWEAITGNAGGLTVYKQSEEDPTLGTSRSRLGPKAYAEHLTNTQKPQSLMEEASAGVPLGASCLIALRHILAREALLQKLQERGSTTAATAAYSSMTKLYQALRKGIHLVGGEDKLRHLLFAAVLHPLRGLLAVFPTGPRVRPVAGALVSISWKLPNADATATESLINHAALLHTAAQSDLLLHKQALGQEEQQQQRIRLGTLVREVGSQWREALLLAAAEVLGAVIYKDTAASIAAARVALTASPLPTAVADTPGEGAGESHVKHRRGTDTGEEVHEQKKLEEAAIEAIRRMVHLKDTIEALDLQDAWRMPPLCNGKQVARALPGASGPILGEVMEKQRIWQFANPGKSAEECLSYLQEVFPHLVGTLDEIVFRAVWKGPLVGSARPLSTSESIRHARTTTKLLPKRGFAPRVLRKCSCPGVTCSLREISTRVFVEARQDSFRRGRSLRRLLKGEVGTPAPREIPECLPTEEGDGGACIRPEESAVGGPRGQGVDGGCPRGSPLRVRFPRPDLDEKALKEEQRKVQRAPHWKFVATQEMEPGGSTFWRRTWDLSFSEAGGQAQAPEASHQKGPLLSPEGQLEKPRPQTREESLSLFCIFDAPKEGGIRVTHAEGAGAPVGTVSRPTTLFSEGPSDWRLDITEAFDADWCRLSGVPWAEDEITSSRGPPDKLEDKRLKVFIPQLGVPKPIALLNRYQILHILERPQEALGLQCVEVSGAQCLLRGGTTAQRVREPRVCSQHLTLEELGIFMRTIAASVPTNRLGILQVLALHAVDKTCTAGWALPRGPNPIEDTEKAAHQKAIVLGMLTVLQPLVLGLQRQIASEASRWHARPSKGFQEKVGLPSAEVARPLSMAGCGPRETGGGLGFACRRLLEIGVNQLGTLEHQTLPRGFLLQLVLCCLSMGSGSSEAPLSIARQCVDFLLKDVAAYPSCKPSSIPTGGSNLERLTTQEAFWVLVSCAYRAARGGPPSWLLPVYNEVLRHPSAIERSSKEGLLGISLRAAPLQMSACDLRCSPPLGRTEGPSANVLSVEQLHSLLEALENAFPRRRAMAVLLDHLLQPHEVRGAAEPSPGDAKLCLSGGSHLAKRFEEWTLMLETCQTQKDPGTSEIRPFDYLDDDESSRSHLEVIETPVAGVLAAVETLAWTIAWMRQQPHQEVSVQKSIASAHSLIVSLTAEVVDSAQASLVPPSALFQGVHILADSVEHLVGTLEEDPIQHKETRTTLAALVGAGALLLRTCAGAMHGCNPRLDSTEHLVEAVSCCVSRYLQSIEVLRPFKDSQQSDDAEGIEAAATAAFLNSSADCLRSLRLWMGGNEESWNPVNLSFRTHGEWLSNLGAILKRAISEQTAGAKSTSLDTLKVPSLLGRNIPLAASAVGAPAAWDPQNGKEGRLLAEEGLRGLLQGLEGFTLCAQLLIKKSIQILAADAATVSAATNGLNYVLEQLIRISPMGSDEEIAAVVRVSSQLLHLQKLLSSTFPRGTIQDLINSICPKVLLQLQGFKNKIPFHET